MTRSMTRVRRVTHIATAGVATAVISLATPACGVPHPGISNGSVTACYRAIPAATAALHAPHPRLLGVHRLSADAVARYLPSSNLLHGETDTEVCAVAFQGAFGAGQVDKADPSGHGKYAIVLITSRHLDLLVSFVVDHIPKRFRGRFV